jgi:hypothetical protein
MKSSDLYNKDGHAPPCWWQQGYTYALAAVAGAHLVLAPVLIKLIEGSPNFVGEDEVAVGIMLGQAFLLGLWAALGGLGTIPRWGLVGTLCTVGVTLIVLVVKPSQQSFLETFLFAGLLAVLFVTGVAMCLLPLRGLAGWRVDFDPAYYAHLPLRRGQVRLLDCAGYTCAVAGPLVVVRLMLELSDEDRAGIGTVIATLSLIAGAAAIPSFVILSWRRFWLGLIVATIWIACTILVHSQLSRHFDGLSMGTGRWWWQFDLRIAAFHAGVGIAVVMTLGYLRRWGLKLLVVPQPEHSAASTKK